MPTNPPFALAIHGGAGAITPDNLPPDQADKCRDALAETLRAVHAMLRDGASALDALEAAVVMLEDAPQFNAGRGACYTHDGRHELDASIMCGRTLEAGAVAGVHTVRNPIRAARAVMERSPYVLLIGRGAETFAGEQNLEIVEPSYFGTPRQWQRLQQMRGDDPLPANDKFGTVGAVALNTRGDLAAATSTGGMINRRFGRVGDSPIIGAGTYAHNATCAVSATGHGEHFICQVAAYDIAALMGYRELSLHDATREVVMGKLKARGGEGGVIAVDGRGNVELCFNCAGMYRGSIGADGAAQVAIFRE